MSCQRDFRHARLPTMAAVAIAATVVQSYSAQGQAPLVCRLLSHFAHARDARPASAVAPRGHEPSAIRSRSQKLLARTAADSTIAAAAVELSRRLVPHMLPPCGCCRRAWRSAVLQGSADSILPRILLPPPPNARRKLSWTTSLTVTRCRRVALCSDSRCTSARRSGPLSVGAYGMHTNWRKLDMDRASGSRNLLYLSCGGNARRGQ